MLIQMTDLIGRPIAATDGVIGSVKDLYFDDKAWVARYFIVETGSWLSPRCVLISPAALSVELRDSKALSALLTMRQVEDSPPIDTERPVSLQHEMEYIRFYGYAWYWSGGDMWGRGSRPGSLLSTREQERPEDALRRHATDDARSDRDADAEHHPHANHHLRSCRTVSTYHVHASDGDIGHVKDFLLDDETWEIRYLVVSTSNWWLGHDVMVSPEWIDEVSWDDNKVLVNLDRGIVRGAPPYSFAIPADRGQEIRIHEHYDRQPYGVRNVKSEIARIPAVAANRQR